MADYQAGKLKDSHVKKFLANYYDGSPYDMLKGSNKQALLEDYILIHEALVGDDLIKHDFKRAYTRNGIRHCCGQANVQLREGVRFCEVCGSEYFR